MFYYNKDEAVESSSIDHVYYNSNTYELVVKFTNGNSAGYRKVGNQTYDKFINAQSVGQYYNWSIKGVHSGFKVDGVAPLAPVKEQVSEPAVAERPNAAKFRVVAEITGGATLDVYATDVLDALKVAEEQINRAFNGDVKVIFKGVNLV